MKKKPVVIGGVVALVALIACVAVWQPYQREAPHPPAQTQQKVRLLLDWSVGSEHAFLSLGKQKGTFAAEGVDLDVISGEGSSKTANQVDAGGAEFGLCAGETALLAYSKGKKVRALAVFYPNTPATILSLANKGIKRPEDLYGKKLGYIQGSSAYRNYEAFAAKVHLDRPKIDEIPIQGKLTELIAENARIDAMVHFSYQYPLQLKLQGNEVDEIPFREYGIKIYGLCLITSDDVLAKNPDLARHMTKTVVDAYRDAVAHPDDALAAFLKEHPDQDAQYSKAKLQWICQFVAPDTKRIGEIGKHDLEGWTTTAGYLLETKQVSAPVENVSGFFSTQFVP